MKKTISLVIALLLIMSFVACGNTEPEPLPVKFGSITAIETLENNAESIVLSMNEPYISQGAEAEVYFSTIDYIFSHASKDLTSVSVSAFDKNGNSIMSFIIPSYLIDHMREVEATGTWGTEGFYGYYFFNHDAFDELVASISAANEVVPEATEGATATVEATTSNQSIKSGNITIAFSYGERSGMYVGFVDENGLPDGTGTFEAVNSEGVKWTYSGDWKHGHMDGYGMTKWETGEIHCGKYANDQPNGYGTYVVDSKNTLAGNFVGGNLNGYGAAYVDGEFVFWGSFDDGYADAGTVYLPDGSVYDATLTDGTLTYYP